MKNNRGYALFGKTPREAQGFATLMPVCFLTMLRNAPIDDQGMH
jgi:hypothetical protein